MPVGVKASLKKERPSLEKMSSSFVEIQSNKVNWNISSDAYK